MNERTKNWLREKLDLFSVKWKIAFLALTHGSRFYINIDIMWSIKKARSLFVVIQSIFIHVEKMTHFFIIVFVIKSKNVDERKLIGCDFTFKWLTISVYLLNFNEWVRLWNFYNKWMNFFLFIFSLEFVNENHVENKNIK